MTIRAIPIHHTTLMKRFLFSLFAVSIFTPLAAQEADGSIEEAFRRGLFAEEVDADLEEAESAYAEVLKRFYEQKKLAATAAYRLAEVHRKLAVSNPEGRYEELAAQQYERVIREFPEAEALAKLSRDNLAAMGKPIPEAEAGSVNALDEEDQIIAQLKHWKETSPDKLTERPTPLYRAAMANQLRVAKYLIDQDVDLDRDDVTALSVAAGEGHLTMVELLLNAGADPRPKEKSPPIHQALKNDRMEVVKKLIEVGAHLKLENHKEDLPLQFISNLRERSGKRTIQVPEKRLVEYAGLLIDAGAAVDKPSRLTGKTAFFEAVENRFPEMASLLLENGADVNFATSDTQTNTLILAVKTSKSYRILDMIKLLLAAGAKVDQADANGFTALHHCLLEELPFEYVEVLIEAGADVTQRVSKDGWTPLHFWALNPDNDRIARALYRAGGNPIALATSYPEIKVNIPIHFTNTPLGILHEKEVETEAIVREFYEHGIQTFSPDKFAGAVWFSMPFEPDRKEKSESGLEPNDLIPNLFPVFEMGKNAPKQVVGDEMAGNELPPPGLSNLIIKVFDRSTPWDPQQTPGLDKLRILRPEVAKDGEPGWKVVSILFEDIEKAANEGSDIPLQWGDVVLFDLLDQRRPYTWSDLDPEKLPALSQGASLDFKLTLGSQSSDVSILPRSNTQSIPVAGHYRFADRSQVPSSILNLYQFIRYRDDLDLREMKVVRKLGDQTRQYSVPYPAKDEKLDFFLRDGDQVIIPHKQGKTAPEPTERDSAIWIQNSNTQILHKTVYLGSFDQRPVKGISLARVIAKYYANGRKNLLLPFPDFSKIRLEIPGTKAAKEVALISAEGKLEDIEVPWGTIVNLSAEEGTEPSEWMGLSKEQQKFLTDSTKVTITIQPEGMDPRPVTASFTFPGYEKNEVGELTERYRSTIRQPNFWDLLGDEFRGEDAKWDSGRFILEADGKRWNYTSGHQVSDFFDGDILKIFRKL